MAEQSTGKDRRRLKRIVRRIPVSFMAGGRRVEGYIKNLSKEGVFIRADALPQAGETVHMLIQPTAVQKIDVSAVIRWTTDQYLNPDDISIVGDGFGD